MAEGGCEAAWSTIPCLTSKQDKVNDTTPVIQSNLSACCLFSIDIGPQCCQCIQTAIMCSMFIKCSPTRTLGTMKPSETHCNYLSEQKPKGQERSWLARKYTDIWDLIQHYCCHKGLMLYLHFYFSTESYNHKKLSRVKWPFTSR